MHTLTVSCTCRLIIPHCMSLYIEIYSIDTIRVHYLCMHRRLGLLKYGVTIDAEKSQPSAIY